MTTTIHEDSSHFKEGGPIKTKSQRMTYEKIVTIFCHLEMRYCPLDNYGDRIHPRGYVYANDRKMLELNTQWLECEFPLACRRLQHGFSCPTVADRLAFLAHQETVGAQDRRTVGYIYDRWQNVVYRITPHADRHEVYALVESLLRREFRRPAHA